LWQQKEQPLRQAQRFALGQRSPEALSVRCASLAAGTLLPSLPAARASRSRAAISARKSRTSSRKGSAIRSYTGIRSWEAL
jgi:hypothetical protein